MTMSSQVQVKFEEETAEVPEGYEEVAKAIFQCGIHLLGISFDTDSEEEVCVAFGSAGDCERFADVIVACASKELTERLFGNTECLSGNFFIDVTEDNDECRTFTTMELFLPRSIKDELLTMFSATAKLVEAEVTYCDNASRRSTGTMDPEVIPKTEWDGHFVSNVPGSDEIGPGSIVKVIFHATNPIHAQERLWIRVTMVDEDEITGTVDNHPASLTNVHHGETVHFRRHNIIRVAPPQKQTEIQKAALN